MAKKVRTIMHCPKCGHQQVSQDECESCGLLFAKFERRQDRKQEQVADQSGEKARGSNIGSRLVPALVLVALTASLTYYWTGAPKQEKVPRPVLPAAGEVAGKTGRNPQLSQPWHNHRPSKHHSLSRSASEVIPLNMQEMGPWRLKPLGCEGLVFLSPIPLSSPINTWLPRTGASWRRSAIKSKQVEN